jgi:hypothetical protein
MGIMISADGNHMDVMDRALDADALFTPQVAPLTLPNGSETEFKTVYRETEDGEQILLNAAVKQGYHAGSYAGIVQTADALFPGTCTGLSLVDGGKRLVFAQEIGDDFDLGGGDTISNHLLFVASLDSTWATACYGMAYRAFCTNQIPTGMVQISQKRTVNHDALLFQKAQVLADAVGRFEEFVGHAGMMRGIAIDSRNYHRILNILVPAPEGKDGNDPHGRAVNAYEAKIAGIAYFWEEEVDRVGANAWALYSAVQSYEFHTATKGDAAKQAEVIRQPGKGQALTERVRELVLV